MQPINPHTNTYTFFSLFFDYSPQKCHALNLRAYMHGKGLGGEQNYPEAIKLGNASARASLASLQKQVEEQQNKRQQQQSREQLNAALDPYKDKFNDLLEQLKGIRDLLAQKAKNNSKYETVASGVSKLCTTLKEEMSAFFENPTALKFQQCHQQCALAITATAEESAKHRGWHAVDPIIRGIIGVLAAIAVVPALIVEVTSTHGYMQTFFAKPATATSEKIAAITTQFNEQKEEFEKQESVSVPKYLASLGIKH